METVEHTASTILVIKWWLRVKRKDSFYSILELWLFTNHMDICGCSFLFFSFYVFFCSHIRRVGFASALLPYGHWVVLVWGRVVGVARSYDWTDGWLWILRLDQAKEWKDGLFLCFLFCFVFLRVQGWEGQYEYTWLVHLSSPPPSWALTPCPHQLTYALLFIQAVRYHFGDGSTIATGGLLRLCQSRCNDIPKLY